MYVGNRVQRPRFIVDNLCFFFVRREGGGMGSMRLVRGHMHDVTECSFLYANQFIITAHSFFLYFFVLRFRGGHLHSACSLR